MCSFLTLASCNKAHPESNGQESGFSIYLTDGGGLVLSDDDIKVYRSEANTFELNEKGIDKWNSYIQYPEPKLADSLFGHDFIIKIEGREVCSGTFWSMVSSTSRDSIVILDALFKLDTSHNTISLKPGYASVTKQVLDLSITSALDNFFNNAGLSKSSNQ